jgi:hypothetical protein
MMAWTHAAIGAAVGTMTPTEEAALVAGVVSHGVADLMPHRDFNMEVELPLLALMLVAIAWRFGLRSRQFWGAVGGFLPDIENGLEILGFLSGTVFPTHTKKAWFIGHGRKIKSIVPQIILIGVCLLIADHKTSG